MKKNTKENLKYIHIRYYCIYVDKEVNQVKY